MLRSDRRLSITQIAHRCGFSSSQYFAKVLREHTGKTPTELRESTSKDD
jgi:AraC-like DNA-binding protein